MCSVPPGRSSNRLAIRRVLIIFKAGFSPVLIGGEYIEIVVNEPRTPLQLRSLVRKEITMRSRLMVVLALCVLMLPLLSACAAGQEASGSALTGRSAAAKPRRAVTGSRI